MNIEDRCLIARWDEWKIKPHGACFYVTAPGKEQVQVVAFSNLDLALLPYDSSRDACAEFEAIAKEKGKLRRYLDYLWNTVEDPHSSNDSSEHIEEIWPATPVQRCEAILQVIKEEGKL